MEDSFHTIFVSGFASDFELREWLKVMLAPAVAAGGFYFLNKQLKIAADQAITANKNLILATNVANEGRKQEKIDQEWKKSQFLAEQVRDFFADLRIERVIYILDWERREIFIENNIAKAILFVHDHKSMDRLGESVRKTHEDTRTLVVVSDALQYHEEISCNFTKCEAYTRDEFDWLFFRLGQFHALIESGLFTFDDLEKHLKYLLDLLTGRKGNISALLVKRIEKYVQKYDFEGAKKLMDLRKLRDGPASPNRSSSRLSSTASG